MNQQLTELISRIETGGGELALLGDRVRVKYPFHCKEALSPLLDRLREKREELAILLRARITIGAIPRGVRLVNLNLMQPPVAIETCAVVMEPALFARTTLEQLRIALTEQKRWVGWTIPQLVDRLHQVGVDVALEQDVILKLVRRRI